MAVHGQQKERPHADEVNRTLNSSQAVRKTKSLGLPPQASAESRQETPPDGIIVDLTRDGVKPSPAFLPMHFSHRDERGGRLSMIRKTMKLPIETLRQVLRLACDMHYSNRAVGRLSGVVPNTVRAVRDLLRLGQYGWDDLKDLDNDGLRQALFGSEQQPPSRKPQPDWLMVHAELQKRDVTLELLWDEYRAVTPDGISYAQFTRSYRKWRKGCKLSLRYVYHSGEMLFVDFCGKTMPIRNRDTGEVRKVQIFVGTLGASGYLFATAVETQTIEDWLKAHVRMLEHIDGVPRFIVPDNLKSAVTKHTRSAIVLNPAYQELAEHYGFVILPARPRQPKDKALAEVGVQIVQRWVLARLRHQVFFSLDELNHALDYWMRQLNHKTTRTYPQSRMSRLAELDTPA